MTHHAGDAGWVAWTNLVDVQIAAKAEQADMLSRLNWTGAFVTATNYIENDLVTNGGGLYRARMDFASTSAPAVDGDVTYWERVAGSAIASLDTMPPGFLGIIVKVGGIWPGGTDAIGIRPSAREDISFIWYGELPMPAIVSSGTGGMIEVIDIPFIITP